MAITTTTIVEMTDDLDGTQNDTVKTREFRFSKIMELSDENYVRVAAEIGSLLAKARDSDTTSAPKHARGGRKTPAPEQTARNLRIRAWAKVNRPGEVSDRGRPRKEIEDAYKAATGDMG